MHTSVIYSEHLAEHGIAPSVGTVGDGYDNAMAESGIGLYKTELIRRQGPWRTVNQVEIATFEYIDWFNRRRLHGEIGHVLPAEYEAMFYADRETVEIKGWKSLPNPGRFKQPGHTYRPKWNVTDQASWPRTVEANGRTKGGCTEAIESIDCTRSAAAAGARWCLRPDAVSVINYFCS